MGNNSLGVVGDLGAKTFLLAFFSLLIIAVLSSQYWHISAPQPLFRELYLASYDNQVYAGQEACFSLVANSENFPPDRRNILEILRVEVGEVVVIFREELPIGAGLLEKCIPAAKLSEGNNLVEVFYGSEHLFFNVSKSGALPPPSGQSEIRFIKSEGSRIWLEVVNNSAKGGVYPLRTHVNGVLQSETMLSVAPNSSETVEIEPDLGQGSNKIEFSFPGTAVLSREAAFSGGKGIDSLIGLPLFLLLFALFIAVFLSHYHFLEALLYSFSSFFSALVFVPWLLDLFSISLNFYSLFISLALTGISLYLILRNRPCAAPENGEAKWFTKYFVLCAVFLLAMQFFIPSHFNNWNVFYERQAELITANNSIPSLDPLSYLGRGFSFVWGYFLFNSSLSLLTGLSGAMLFALVFFLVNSIFFVSVLYFARSLELEKLDSLILYLLLISSLFIFVVVMISPKHVLSFAFLFIGTAMLIKKKNPFLAGAFVGIGAFTQASFLFLFPLAYLISAKRIEWKPLIKAVFFAALVFLILFAPLFLSVGWPYEIFSEEWGYLIKHSPLNLLTDLGQIISLLFLVMFARVARQWKTLSPYAKKLFLSGIALIIIQSFIAYRVNIITHLVLAVLLFEVFSEQFRERFFALLIIVLCILSVLANLTILSYSNATANVFNSMRFIDSRAAANENTLTDPFYAHLESYLGKRKVLADLYVEYADEEKLRDSYEFILDEKEAILDKYNISYVLTEREKIFKKAGELHYFGREKEFDFMDKVYSNNIMAIHRRRD